MKYSLLQGDTTLAKPSYENEQNKQINYSVFTRMENNLRERNFQNRISLLEIKKNQTAETRDICMGDLKKFSSKNNE